MLNAVKHLPGLVSGSNWSKSADFYTPHPQPTDKNTSAPTQNARMCHNSQSITFITLNSLWSKVKSDLNSSQFCSKRPHMYSFTLTNVHKHLSGWLFIELIFSIFLSEKLKWSLYTYKIENRMVKANLSQNANFLSRYITQCQKLINYT